MLYTLRTREALQRVFEVAAQFSNSFEIRARFQGRDICPDKGVHLIICEVTSIFIIAYDFVANSAFVTERLRTQVSLVGTIIYTAKVCIDV